MPGHYEESLERDIARIRTKTTAMATLCEGALRSAIEALVTRDRQLAYSVILRDQEIDEHEKEIDRLCLEFIARQQPVAGHLRFAFAAIKIDLELERVGDYAESIARQSLAVCTLPCELPDQQLRQLAELAIPMLHGAAQAFVLQDPDLARQAMAQDDAVDARRHALSHELVALQQAGKIPLSALGPLLNVINRLERVADQAKSISQEVLYMCTGQYLKHQGSEVFRVLFVDEHDACRSPMAEAIGTAMNEPRFVFTSAGLDPHDKIDEAAAAFLEHKGLTLSHHRPQALRQVPNLEHYQVVVALAESARAAFPPPPTKTVCIEWILPDPTAARGTEAEVAAAFEEAYGYIGAHIRDLVQAILGASAPATGESS
jgi:phosphate transport system protein